MHLTVTNTTVNYSRQLTGQKLNKPVSLHNVQGQVHLWEKNKSLRLTVFCPPCPSHLSLTLNSRFVEVTSSTRSLVNDRRRLQQTIHTIYTLTELTFSPSPTPPPQLHTSAAHVVVIRAGND